MTPEQSSHRVMVGIPTTGRTSLAATIESVVNSAERSGVKVKILLVANGESPLPDETIMQDVPTNVTIAAIHEPRRGYSNARNAILSHLDAPILAMVDDDEVVDADWIESGLSELSRWDATAVAGPVNYVISYPTAAWIHRRRVFSSPDRRRGDELKVCSSNNIFIDSTRIHRICEFDQKYNTSGGEDTDWTFKLYREGHRIVWSTSVRVSEFVASDRLNKKYIRNRFKNNGKILAGTLYAQRPTISVIGPAVTRILVGSIRTALVKTSSFVPISFLPTWLYNDAEAMIWRGCGMLSHVLTKHSNVG